MAVSRYIIVALLLLHFSGSATAQEVSDPSRKEQVEKTYAKAVEAYKSGDYDTAANAFLEVHAIAPSAVLLYNAANAFARAGRYERAIEEAQRADGVGLDDPKTATRNDARLAAWRARILSIEVAEAKPSPKIAEAPPDTGGWDLLPIFGSVLGVTGGGLLIGAYAIDRGLEGREEDLRDASARDDRADYDAVLSDIEDDQRLGQIFVVTGGVLLTTGVVLWSWHLLDDEDDVAVSVMPGPTSVSVSARW